MLWVSFVPPPTGATLCRNICVHQNICVCLPHSCASATHMQLSHTHANTDTDTHTRTHTQTHAHTHMHTNTEFLEPAGCPWKFDVRTPPNRTKELMGEKNILKQEKLEGENVLKQEKNVLKQGKTGGEKCL